MLKVIFLSIVIFILCSTDGTTHDPEFEKEYQVTHIKEGDGKTFPKKEDNVFINYTGTLLNGKKFDSSFDRNKPFEFKLGLGHVIRCWDIVVARLSLGEKIKVVCPYRLAYGQRGIGTLIPPKSDLIFEMELIKIDRNEENNEQNNEL